MSWRFTPRNRRPANVKQRMQRRRLTLERLEDRRVLATYTVNTDGTEGLGSVDGSCDSDPATPGNQCTFNAALALASFQDSITFSIATVNLGSNSPNINSSINIDGGGGVQINGDIRIFADDSSVRNLTIVGDVLLFNSSNATISDNEFIQGGIVFERDSSGNHILNNRVTGDVGISTSLYVAHNNEIKGNTVTGGGGIFLREGDGNFIENNVVLGSNGNAITLGRRTVGNVIQGNSVGVDPSTNQIVAIAGNGLSISGMGHTIVGNTIGNSQVGIELTSDAANGLIGGGHTVQKNFIGTNSDETLDLGNRFGIGISGDANTIGGPAAADGNAIAYNDFGGVVLIGFTGIAGQARNRIQGNRIHDNGGLGIDLGSLGVTANDAGDADIGPNNLQNAPVIKQPCDGQALVTLSSTPNTTFVIDIYSNSQPDPSGSGEGESFLGSVNLTTDEQGFGSVASPFTAEFGRTLSATATDPDGNTSEFSSLQLRPPVFILPGVAGTFATPESHQEWVVTRGISSESLEIDPIGWTYRDLVRTLRNAGYQDEIDLFVVNYDWRMPPAPDDGTADGHISGLTAADISQDRVSGKYRTGVDYLGQALRRAAESWTTNCSSLPLQSVDVIAHSTGGLVTRAYIQSDAYNGIYEGSLRLPAINRFIMLDVPNQGATKPWNPLHDEWDAISDSDVSYRFLSNFPEAAFRKVANGETIHGPDYDIQRGPGLDQPNIRFVDVTIEDGEPVRNEAVASRFIDLYIPTLRTLLATYDFIDNGDGTRSNVNQSSDRNWLGLDLNAGIANHFVGKVGQVIAVYGDGVTTPTTVTQQTCGFFTSLCPDRYSMLDSYVDNDRESGDIYWTENTTQAGDGTVPRVSLVGQFENDVRVIKSRWVKGENTNDAVEHAGIVMNRDVQRAILTFLGHDPTNVTISYGSQRGATGLSSGYTLIADPVEAILTDANGKRLGYSRTTGVLTEIPNSVYVGEADGIGFIFGPVALPLRLDLAGLGEGYFVEVSGQQDGNVAEFEVSGTLGVGEVLSFDVPVGPKSDITAPSTLSFVRQNPSSSPTNADALVFRATFSKPVTAVDSLDFAADGTTTATVTSVATVSGDVYDITVSGGDLANFNGTVGLNLSSTQNITDLTGNPLPSTEPIADETFVVQNFDFGDLLDSHKTLLASDGPRHALGFNLFLGTRIDADADGQPSATAGVEGTGGDDNDAEGDDEDGVALISSLVATAGADTIASMSVVASAAGKLDAWIDFNANGRFDHPAEHLKNGFSLDVVAGINVLGFTVPAGSSIGNVGARVRFSSTGGLLPTGPAADGEVEDYFVSISDGDSPSGASVVIKAPVSSTLDVVADDNDVVVRRGLIELFRAPGSALARLDVFGLDGDDTLNITNLDAIFAGFIGGDAGSGNDTLRLAGHGQHLDLTQIPDTDIQGLETIDITGDGDNTLTLDVDEVLQLTSTTNTLRVVHNDGDLVRYGRGWAVEIPQIIASQFVHVLKQTGATIEVANTTSFRNPFLPLDVNRDGNVAPIDALIVINRLNGGGPGSLATPSSVAGLTEFFYIDTNGDRAVAPIDALIVINFLNDPTSETEGESGVALNIPSVFAEPFGSAVTNTPNQERRQNSLPASPDSVSITVGASAAAGGSRSISDRLVSSRAKSLTEDSELENAINEFFADLL